MSNVFSTNKIRIIQPHKSNEVLIQEMIEDLDILRQEAIKKLDQRRRGELGQYMTPNNIAQFMASLFEPRKEHIRFLEAGAGIGSLVAAFLENVKLSGKEIFIQAYEIEPTLIEYLKNNLKLYKQHFESKGLTLITEVITKDFILEGISELKCVQPNFTHALLNPPYKKIHSQSAHRHALQLIGQEHVNLYTAFVSVALSMLKEGGQLVAIIPRSFCNGLYYKPFRQFILKNASIKRLHLFESRTQAFKEDEILQENIIIHLEKHGKQSDVLVSTSTDQKLNDLCEQVFPFSSIVSNDDTQLFIHVPNLKGNNNLTNSDKITYTLTDIGLQVSTGPVVDFRMKKYLRMKIESGCIPLLYPSHFNGNGIDWPKNGKKPNAILLNKDTEKSTLPIGFYTIVKRFSSKEEKQRIVARVVNPKKLSVKSIGIENHLNYFHSEKKGINENLAYGLSAYLNTSFVDHHFRSFNGHTQVNATDLRQLKYPSKKDLMRLGKWAKKLEFFSPESLDERVKKIL